mgnify:CR=1 FL=1
MKAELLRQAIRHLEVERDHLASAALETKAGATDGESRSESKYDTRGLEAGYLAQGQAQQANLLEEQIAYLNQLELPEESDSPLITRGSIVVLGGDDGEEENFFILPYGGGSELDWQGQICTVLSAEAPLAVQLLGRGPGESLSDGRFISEVY